MASQRIDFTERSWQPQERRCRDSWDKVLNVAALYASHFNSSLCKIKVRIHNCDFVTLDFTRITSAIVYLQLVIIFF